MAITKRKNPPEDMHIEGSPKLMSTEETGSNMDLDDLADDDPDGGVSLVPWLSPPTHTQSWGRTASLGLGLTLTTDLPSAIPSHGPPSTPKVSSSLPTIHEEAPTALSSDMDFSFDDMDDMPPLEETIPSLPGTWPIVDFATPFKTRYGPSSPSPLKNLVENAIENRPSLPPRSSSLPDAQKSNVWNGGGIDAAYSDDESPTRGEEEMKEEKEAEKVRVEWSNDIWPPENRHERALCERVCSDVARAHGFQRVYIKRPIITQHTSKTFSTTRTIYVEPHFVAMFVSFPPPSVRSKQPSNWSSIYKANRKYHLRSQDIAQKREEKGGVIRKTAELHIGPGFARPEGEFGEEEEKEMWAQWGLWRKAGKEVVEWCWEEDLRDY
ncbi:hypothetical protein N431DRAFT_510751 [Stipitochalara longipes BDJ]|nr:hypothetical protein N431DRAFT_510751 [Stipitochalara longipes BDJ]